MRLSNSCCTDPLDNHPVSEFSPSLKEETNHTIRLMSRLRGMPEAAGEQALSPATLGAPHHRFSTTPFITEVSFGSVFVATAMISSTFAGWRESGKHSSVMMEIPNTCIPI